MGETCPKGYQIINGKCAWIVHIRCEPGYSVHIDKNGKQYCKKSDSGSGEQTEKCNPYDKDGREDPSKESEDCPGGGYCPNDDTSFCWRSQLDFAKALAKNQKEHCGEVTKPFRGYPEVKYAHEKYPQLFKNVDCIKKQPQARNIVNNKIYTTNKYTTKTNIIRGPAVLEQQKFNGTINDRFIEFTDMPANSTIIVPSPTAKTRNVLKPGAIDVTGELKNIGVRQAKFISMVITVYNKFNQTLALESTSPQPNSILPGQAAPFKFSIGIADGLQNRTQDVASVKYHWNWFDENGKKY